MSLYDTIGVLNELKHEHAIEGYAIMGGYAVNYYIEPTYTMDMDVLILLGGEADLHKIFSKLTEMGYKFSGLHVVIEGTPVQFLPTYISPLYEEALQQSKSITVRDKTVKIVSVEYLIAFFLTAFRAKDKIRVAELVKLADKEILNEVLKKHETAEVPLQKRLQQVLGYSKEG